MNPIQEIDSTKPHFLNHARKLATITKKLEIKELKNLMNISSSVAELNFERFKSFGQQKKKQAALAFAGDTYKGLKFSEMNIKDREWAQKHLRILSGLYGILRPLDEIEPYRLEMGSKLRGAHGSSLYDYWGNKISENLNNLSKETGTNILVNCASKEYFNVINLKNTSLKVITPVFMERKNGKEKVISFYAKNARGAMARFIIKNRLVNEEDLKKFDLDGYSFNVEKSKKDKFVFLR